jgi:hypothetical protein
MATHIQVAGVIKENDSRRAGWVRGLTQQATDEDIRPTRLVDDSGADVIEAIAKEIQSLCQWSASKFGATVNDDSGRFTTSMRINDTNGLHRGSLKKESDREN